MVIYIYIYMWIYIFIYIYGFGCDLTNAKKRSHASPTCMQCSVVGFKTKKHVVPSQDMRRHE